MAQPAPIRLAVTPGEPAGIGPELVAQVITSPACRAMRERIRDRFDGQDLELVVVADPELLQARASAIGIELAPTTFTDLSPHADYDSGVLPVLPVPLTAPSVAGRADPRNAAYVLATLGAAVTETLSDRFDAMVTGPVNKAVINEGGVAFTGHTEWIAEHTGAPLPVMMLAAPALKVALVTTHLPLRSVPDAITTDLVARVLRIVDTDLRVRLGIAAPRIGVCGLNPHAGEEGHLGREEEEVIAPAIGELQGEGLNVTGPWPADTIFTPRHLDALDIVVAMYHDQGLAPLKQVGFGRSVNITLGLPIIRTSVDHGTAFDLAGTGRADGSSLLAAIEYAAVMAKGRDMFA